MSYLKSSPTFWINSKLTLLDVQAGVSTVVVLSEEGFEAAPEDARFWNKFSNRENRARSGDGGQKLKLDFISW